jgi:nitroreductase
MKETELLRTLRAVRRFADREIPNEVLADILEVGRWTGSSKNTQPWELIVVRKRETLQRLADCGPFAGHLAGAAAAVALVMHGSEAETGFDEGRLAQNLMLAAWAKGVGSCIGSIYLDDNEARAKAVLAIPSSLSLRTMLSLGYPVDASAMRLPASSMVPRGRKPLDQFVSWEVYGRRSAG